MNLPVTDVCTDAPLCHVMMISIDYIHWVYRHWKKNNPHGSKSQNLGLQIWALHGAKNSNVDIPAQDLKPTLPPQAPELAVQPGQICLHDYSFSTIARSQVCRPRLSESLPQLGFLFCFAV